MRHTIAAALIVALSATVASAGSRICPFRSCTYTCGNATPDSATSPHTPNLVGFQFPDLVPASFPGGGNANAFNFNGTSNGANSSAINWGNSATGVPGVSGVGAAGAFDLEGEIKTNASPVLEIFSGRTSTDGNTTAQPLVYTDGNHFFCDFADNTGAAVHLSSSSTISSNTNYNYACDYDGTTARLWLSFNGAPTSLEASSAVSGVAASNGTDRFFIGRYDNATPDQFTGLHGRLRWSKVSRHTAIYTPSTANSYTNDSNTLGLLQMTATSCN